MIWEIPETDTYFAPLLKPEGWEIDHLEEALKFCKSFRTAIDGGAHIGTWAVRMARHFDQVLAFEPNYPTLQCLLKNTHNHAPTVAVMGGALGDVSGYCMVVEDTTRKGNTGAYMIDIKPGGTVPVMTVDQFLLDDLDLLKLDVEGSEILALKGAQQTIGRCKPVIVAECKEFTPPRNGGVAATKDWLNGIGYREVGGISNDRIFVPK